MRNYYVNHGNDYPDLRSYRLLFFTFANTIQSGKDFGPSLVWDKRRSMVSLVINVFSGFSFLPILWALDVLPDQILYIEKFLWWLLSLVGQFAGVGIILVGLWQTGLLSLLGIVQIISGGEDEVGGVFVKRGLNPWVRHPLYMSGLLFIWCTPVMTRNLLVFFFCFLYI